MFHRWVTLVSLCIGILPTTAGSISSGWPALDREFPSTVLIWTIEDNKPKFLCSGVILAPDTVATAASCVYTETHLAKSTTLLVSNALKIDFKLPLSQALQSVSAIAKKGVRHHEADLMLIFLNQPLMVNPAILLSTNETFQIRLINQVILSGYGYPNAPQEPGKIQKILEAFNGTAKPQERGEKLIAKSRIVSVSSKELLVAKTTEDGAGCGGDEGAPVFAYIDTPFTNSQRVLGIIASSTLLPSCGQPTMVIRLDAYREFINDKMTLACRNKERVWCKSEGLLEPGHDDGNFVETSIKSSDDLKGEPKTEAVEPKIEKTNEETSPPQKEFVKEQTNSRPRDPKPAPQAPQKPVKRRLTVSAEGAGCSCQQVFTTRP